MTSATNGGFERDENSIPINKPKQQSDQHCEFHIGGRSLTGVTLRAGSEDSSQSLGDESSASSASCFSGSQSSLQLFSPTKEQRFASGNGVLKDSNNCGSSSTTGAGTGLSVDSPSKGEKEKNRPKTLAIPGKRITWHFEGLQLTQLIKITMFSS